MAARELVPHLDCLLTCLLNLSDPARVRWDSETALNTNTHGDALDAAIRPSYAPLVLACALHGIGRTTAFQLARDGQLDTFKIGARTFVTLESLATLPGRMRGESRSPPVRPVQTATARRNSATRGVQA